MGIVVAYMLGIITSYALIYVLNAFKMSGIYREVFELKESIVNDLNKLKINIQTFQINAEQTYNEARMKLMNLTSNDNQSKN